MIFRISVSVLSVLVLTQCAFKGGKKQDEAALAPDPLPPAIIEPATQYWLKTSALSENKKVKLSVEEMTDEERERFKNQFQKTSLKAIAIDPKFNANGFKIEGIEAWKNSVFLAPRLYSYGSVEKGRVLPIKNEDETLSVSFPLVLLDGRQTQILSADGYSSIRISPEFMVNNETELLTALSKQEGDNQSLGVLPGCPRRIFMKVGEKEYDLTPSHFKMADYCPLNQPFNVSLRAKEDEIRFILERAVDVAAVEIFTEYETQAHFTFRKSILHIDSAEFIEELKKHLQSIGKRLKKSEIADVTFAILKKFALQVNLKEEHLARLDVKSKELSHTLFEVLKIEQGTEKDNLDCLDESDPCVLIKNTALSETPEIQIQWSDTLASKSGQIYLTWTKLKPILERMADIGVGPGRLPLRNKLGDLGNVFETGLTAANQDLLEIKPYHVIRERREIPHPIEKKLDNNVCIRSKTVCLKSEPIFERKCEEDCSWTMRCSLLPIPGCFPWKECQEVCKDVQVGEKCIQEEVQCLEYENQWVKRIDYSEPSGSAYEKLDQPISQLPTLFDGLNLGFTFVDQEGNKKSVGCPISQFRREADGGRILIRLENVQGCEPIFTENARVRPMLKLINDMKEHVKYRCGFKEEYWDGRIITDAPGLDGIIRGRWCNYEPTYDLAATVSIKGYDFMSSMSGGKKDPKMP